MLLQWVYKNRTQDKIEYKDSVWWPGDIVSFNEAIPDDVGLICIQQGSIPDPVLCHEDIILEAGEETSIKLNSPVSADKVALNIMCINLDSGAECRFNSPENNPVPIDTRDFSHVMPWVSCAYIYLRNPTDKQVHISVSAVEVVS